MKDIGQGIIVILLGVISVATLAVIVSNRSQTPGVITSFGNAFSSILKAAVSPVMQ